MPAGGGSCEPVPQAGQLRGGEAGAGVGGVVAGGALRHRGMGGAASPQLGHGAAHSVDLVDGDAAWVGDACGDHCGSEGVGLAAAGTSGATAGVAAGIRRGGRDRRLPAVHAAELRPVVGRQYVLGAVGVDYAHGASLAASTHAWATDRVKHWGVAHFSSYLGPRGLSPLLGGSLGRKLYAHPALPFSDYRLSAGSESHPMTLGVRRCPRFDPRRCSLTFCGAPGVPGPWWGSVGELVPA